MAPIKDKLDASMEVIRTELPMHLQNRPVHFLQPAKFKGDGVTVNAASNSVDELIFMAGFFDNENQLRLIRRDGSIVAKWPASYTEIFPSPSHAGLRPKTDWNTDIHGSLVLPDKSVIFNFEYAGLVKLDKLGQVVWKVARSTHHSVELAQDGGFWVPARRYYGKDAPILFPPFEAPYYEDTILKVSSDGEVIQEVSVPKLFYDNNLEALLTSTTSGVYRKNKGHGEIVHLNKVEELTADVAANFPMFQSGDLALSFRDLNLIMVVSPETGRVKWWKIGPWIRQHDPEFREDGKIVIFNNNAYQSAFTQTAEVHKVTPIEHHRQSNILAVDPASGETEIIYEGDEAHPFLSVIRGKVEVTDRGGLLITHFEGGRVIELDQNNQIVWEYINRYNDDEVAEVTEAMIYPTSYFEQ
ncbi:MULTISPECIES: arylsulfotransferase family protein [unclassified Lentimonas]|nr:MULTISPECIES: arylsulfotransferase family protein [unclassified Lentimonas]